MGTTLRCPRCGYGTRGYGTRSGIGEDLECPHCGPPKLVDVTGVGLVTRARYWLLRRLSDEPPSPRMVYKP